MPNSDSNPKPLRVAIVAQMPTDDLLARAASWEGSGAHITWITTQQTGPMVEGAARDGFATAEMWFSNEAYLLLSKLAAAQGAFDYIECDLHGGAGLVLWNAATLQGALADSTISVRGQSQLDQRAADEQHWFDLGMLCRQAMENAVGVGGDIKIDDPPIDHAAILVSASTKSNHLPSDPMPGFRFVFPGPVTTAMGCDLFVRAAKQLEIQRGEAPLESWACEIWGEDSMTGPLGRSCWDRCARYLEPKPRDSSSHAKSAISVSRHDSICDAKKLAGACAVFPGVRVDAVMLAVALGAASGVIVRESTWNRAVAKKLAGGHTCPIHWFGNIEDTSRDRRAVDQLVETMRAAMVGTSACESGSSSGGTGSATGSYRDVKSILNAAHQGKLARVAVTREPIHITVAIPFFNLEMYLPRTLASVHRQSVKPHEIMIVDDGSTSQQAHELLGSLARDGIRIVRQANAGLGAARNTALRSATTPWVLSLDADDLLETTFIECMTDAAQRVGHQADVATIGSFMRCFRDDPGQDLQSEWANPQWTQRWHPIGLDCELLAAANLGCTASCLMHRERILDCGGFDEYMVSFEDWELWCRLAKLGLKAHIIPEYLLRYRQRSQSMYHATALPYEAELRMYILAKHPDLCKDWSRPMRAEIAMRHHIERGQQSAGKPLRYIVADKVNNAAKAIGLGNVLRKIKGTSSR